MRSCGVPWIICLHTSQVFVCFILIFILKKKNQILSVILSSRLKLILLVCGIREELRLHYSPQERDIHLCFHCKWNVNIYLCKANCDLSTEREKEESYQISLLYMHILIHTHTHIPSNFYFLNEQFRWCTRGKTILLKEKKILLIRYFFKGPITK